MSSFIGSLISLAYLCTYQPFNDVRIFRLEILTECLEMVCLYHLICFKGMVADARERYEKTGKSFIYVLGAYMFIHFSVLIWTSLKNGKVYCIRKGWYHKLCCKKRLSQE